MKISERLNDAEDALERLVDIPKGKRKASEPSPREWLERFLRDMSKASAAKQLTVGGVSGWVSGFAFSKIGKVAATAIGGSLLLLQIAQHQGYVKVNWTRLNRDMEQAKKKIEREAHTKLPKVLEEGQRFLQDNVYLATGFAGGFLLGLASS